MVKRKRTEDDGKPCCTRFKLSDLTNSELRYDGKRLFTAPGRRVRPKHEAPGDVIDQQLFTALSIHNPHTVATLETIIKWAASMWPEMGWIATTLPYKVVVQQSNKQIIILL